MTPAAFRRAALITLWAEVLAVAAYGVYNVWQGGPDTLATLLNGADSLLAALSLGLWTVLLAGFLGGAAVRAGDLRLGAFRLIFPWLIALRAAVWLLGTLAILGSAGDSANPIAVLALFLVWGGGIVAGLAVYAISAALFVNPADAAGRARLLTWLNISAALSVAITVMNIWPPQDFGSVPDLQAQLIYTVLGVLDVAATLLALRAVQLAPVGEKFGEDEQ